MKIKLADYDIKFAGECAELLRRYDRNPSDRFSDFMEKNMKKGLNYLILTNDKVIVVIDNLYSPEEKTISANIYFNKNNINDSNVGELLEEAKKLCSAKNSDKIKLIVKQEDEETARLLAKNGALMSSKLVLMKKEIRNINNNKLPKDTEIISLKAPDYGAFNECDRVASINSEYPMRIMEKSRFEDLIAKGSDFLAVKKDGKFIAVGYCTTFGDGILINCISVLPEYRRGGNASSLINAMLENAEKKGQKEASIEVQSKAVSAMSLYKKLGFKEVNIKNYTLEI